MISRGGGMQIEGPGTGADAHDANVQITDLELGVAVRPVDANPDAPGQAKVVKAHWIDALPLARGRGLPTLARASPAQNLFRMVLESRRSAVSDLPPRGHALSDLLEALNWVRREATDSEGRRWSSRLYPSAGGTHCIRFVASVAGVRGWSDGWYRWNADLAAAEPIDVADGAEVIRLVAESVRRTSIDVALVAVADLQLLNQRYHNATSLAWRDAGAALAVAALLAEDCGLLSSLSGASFGLDASPDRPVYVLGALVISGREPEGS